MSASRRDNIAFHPAIDMLHSVHATSLHGINGADIMIFLSSSGVVADMLAVQPVVNHCSSTPT